MRHELLTVSEMYEADRLTIASGVPGEVLMEAAGRGVAEAVMARRDPGSVLVLCGPGNNGGDGFVAARLLADAGWTVTLALLGPRDSLKGDAAAMAGRWNGSVHDLHDHLDMDQDVIIDALFGAGLARPVEGRPADVIEAANGSAALRVAVDVPSGLDGDSGCARGAVFNAHVTVTFFREKPGHLLLPGRACCGDVELVDIGIPDAVIDRIDPRTWGNGPAHWLGQWPWPKSGGHKYSRGHAVVVSGPVHSVGAATLAAYGALRIGSGLVTVACPRDAVGPLATKLTAVMIAPLDDADGLNRILQDVRKNAVLIGPGNGVSAVTRDRVTKVLDGAVGAGRGVVLDADALTVFADQPDDLFNSLNENSVITPHDGEFFRLFPDLKQSESKLDRARRAATRAGAVVVLKGADTVIAAPDGRALINDNAPPDLATAGAGDVLAGMITGLMAQGMPAFEAAGAAVWVHGAAGAAFGVGLIAEDLWAEIPLVLARLRGAGAV